MICEVHWQQYIYCIDINISIIKYIISYKTKNIAQKNEITKNLKTNTDTPLSN